MCMKSDILIQGVSNAEKQYAKCLSCQSVNLTITLEDKDMIFFKCRECGKQDWKTKI